MLEERLGTSGPKHLGRREVRLVVIGGIDVQRRRPGVEVAVNAGDLGPRLASAVRDVDLVPGQEPGGPLLPVDGADELGIEPGQDEALVGQQVPVANLVDAVPIAIAVEADRDPLDGRTVPVVADDKPERTGPGTERVSARANASEASFWSAEALASALVCAGSAPGACAALKV